MTKILDPQIIKKFFYKMWINVATPRRIPIPDTEYLPPKANFFISNIYIYNVYAKIIQYTYKIVYIIF